MRYTLSEAAIGIESCIDKLIRGTYLLPIGIQKLYNFVTTYPIARRPVTSRAVLRSPFKNLVLDPS